MKISTILDHIDSGHMALPEFQRGYSWNRDQVRVLFDSLYKYKCHPVGGLLVMAFRAYVEREILAEPVKPLSPSPTCASFPRPIPLSTRI